MEVVSNKGSTITGDLELLRTTTRNYNRQIVILTPRVLIPAFKLMHVKAKLLAGKS